MGQDPGRDFFISYAGVNRSWAEWIAVQLESAGYSTVLQAWDFQPGSDFLHQMQVAVSSTAERMIAVLSPAYFGSEFGEAEWRWAAFHRDPSGKLGRLIPVRVQQCEPPGMLSGRVFVDLVDADEATCRRVLLAAVDRAGARPTSVPFPGGPVAPTPPPNRFPGLGPEVSNLPPRNRHFSGRDGLLGEIHGGLQRGSMSAVVPTEAVHGLGGIGKTQLAVEYAHRFGSDYDIAWWVPAEEPTAAAAALAELAGRLRVPAAADRSEMVAGLFTLLRGRSRWLLVYDNAEQPDRLTGLLPPDGGGHVLVTSRWQAWSGQATALRLGVLSRAESVAFLHHRTGVDDPAGWTAVAELLGDLPLALAEAAAYLEETGEGLQQYLGLVRDRSRQLFALNGHPAGEHADRRRVGTVWSVALDRVRRQAPVADALLTLCAFLAPDIPRDLPTEQPDVLPGDLAAVVADRLAYNRVLAVIGRYSLAAVTSTTLGVHRLVQAVLQARLNPAAELAWAEAAVSLVRARFPDESWETASWAECERLLPQVLAVTGHAERLGVAGEPAGWLLERASTYLSGRGQYRLAYSLAERGVAVTEAALGPDDPEVAWRRDTLGLVLRDLGDLPGARTHFERAVWIGEARLGPDHPDVGIWRGNLGGVLRDLGDLPGARTQFERAVQISEAALGPDHPTTVLMRDTLQGLPDR